MLNFMWIGFTEQWRTGSKRKIQNWNIYLSVVFEPAASRTSSCIRQFSHSGWWWAVLEGFLYRKINKLQYYGGWFVPFRYFVAKYRWSSSFRIILSLFRYFKAKRRMRKEAKLRLFAFVFSPSPRNNEKTKWHKSATIQYEIWINVLYWIWHSLQKW